MDETIRQNLRRAYDRKAEERDATAKQEWKLGVRGRFLELLLAEQRRTLLELGAGPGQDSLFFQQQGLEVLATDLSPEMVRLCRQKGLRAEVLDFSELALPAASFDAVYAFNSLLHLPKRELPAVLARIGAVLKPGGLFFLGVFGGLEHEGVWPEDTYDPPRFFSFYPHERILELVREHFELVSFDPIDFGSDKKLDFQALVLRKAERPQA